MELFIETLKKQWQENIPPVAPLQDFTTELRVALIDAVARNDYRLTLIVKRERPANSLNSV